MKKRVEWIDYTKGFGILSIILLHVSQYFSGMICIYRYVAIFSVALFFVLSGFVAGSGDKDRYSSKAAQRLLVPYVFFSLINSIMKVSVLVVTRNLSHEVLKKELTELLITGNGTVWFLLTLFFVEMLYVMMNKRKLSLSVRCVLMVMCMILPFCIEGMTNPFYIVFIRVIAGMAFYLLGAFGSKLGVLDRYSNPVVVLLCIFLGGYIAVTSDGIISFFTGQFEGIVGSLSAVLLSCYGYCGLFKVLEYKEIVKGLKRFLSYFGRNSLIVMLMHPTVLLFFTYPFSGLFGDLNGIYSFRCGLMLYMVMIILEIPFIYLINKHFSFLLGKRKSK